MTEAAGERFAGMTALEAREAVVAALREEGRINRTRALHARGPYSQRSGERIEPLISLQWFMQMDELAGPAIAAVDEGRVRIHPEGAAQALPGLAQEHPPVVHLAPAVVGPPDPGLVPRRRDLRRHGRARGAGLGARSRRARHVVLERAVAVRDARLARRDRRAEGVLSHRRALDGARHPVPVGRPHGLHGARVRGRHPVRRRLRALGHPGAGRAADVEVARHGDRPAGADRRRAAAGRVHRGRRVPGLRRRRRPLRAAGDVLDAGRALQRGQDRRGPPARQQALERVAAGPAAGARGVGGAVGRRRSRGAVEDPGSSRACRPREAEVAARSAAFEFHRATLALYASSTASCATGTSSWSSRGCTREDDAQAGASSRCTCWPRRSRSRTR